MQNENTYIGLTIGPIFKTINYAKQTGELWGSSYVFSYLMKNIIRELEKCIMDRFIVPYVGNEDIFKNPTGVGLFHDRFIFKSNEGDFEKVRNAVEKVKGDFTAELLQELNSINTCAIDENKLKEYIDSYFKIFFLEVEVNPNDENEKDRNIILKVSKYLDAVELKEQFIDKEDVNYLFRLLANEKIKHSFLAKDAYGEYKDYYPSLLNIALSELGIDKLPREDSEVKEYIKENYDGVSLKKAHEYVALVQADGDSIGKVIRNIELDNEDKFKNYRKFSKCLLNYAQEAYEKIQSYGGFTVFAGGDDLLFIAPIINRNKDENIFTLIDDLSKCFNEKLKEYNREKPTTSFGISIIHHKYPLYFAIEESRNLLGQAKNFSVKKNGKCQEKNAIAFKVIKSSGESFETVLGKEVDSYEKFRNILDRVFQSAKDTELEKYLKSVHIKLWNDKVIINKIGNNKELLKNYFDNNFNETFHNDTEIKEYIKLIVKFIYSVYNENEENHISDDICAKRIYSCLKFIRFMDEESSFKGKGDKA